MKRRLYVVEIDLEGFGGWTPIEDSARLSLEEAKDRARTEQEIDRDNSSFRVVAYGPARPKPLLVLKAKGGKS